MKTNIGIDFKVIKNKCGDTKSFFAYLIASVPSQQKTNRPPIWEKENNDFVYVNLNGRFFLCIAQNSAV